MAALDLQRPEPPAEYTEILDALAALTRDHLLFYRVEVGGLMLRRFFEGRAELYYSQDPRKAAGLDHFLDTCRDELRLYGLGHRQTLRNCITAAIAFATLPAEVRERLALSEVVELARVSDPTLRTRLALASAEGRWTVATLREAVRRAKAGEWYDAEPGTPGTQPPPASGGSVRQLSPRRLVTRGEKLVPTVDAWAQALAAVDPSQLAKQEKARLAATLAGMQARLDAVRALLGE